MKRNEAGFTLIELMVAVAIIAIVASMAAVSLMRARISANEAGALGDIRAILSAEAAYSITNNSAYGHITCLGKPADCLPNYSGPPYLDPNMTVVTTIKSGYNRTFVPGTAMAPSNTIGIGSMSDFSYQALPVSAAQGTHGFVGDGKLRICQSSDGGLPVITPTCQSPQ